MSDYRVASFALTPGNERSDMERVLERVRRAFAQVGESRDYEVVLNQLTGGQRAVLHTSTFGALWD